MTLLSFSFSHVYLRNKLGPPKKLVDMDLSPWSIFTVMIHPFLVMFHEDDDVPSISASVKVKVWSTSRNGAYKVATGSSSPAPGASHPIQRELLGLAPSLALTL